MVVFFALAFFAVDFFALAFFSVVDSAPEDFAVDFFAAPFVAVLASAPLAFSLAAVLFAGAAFPFAPDAPPRLRSMLRFSASMRSST